jgi:hypothetical protein
MRRLLVQLCISAIATASVLLADPISAQPAMDFRPVPADSVDHYVREARRAARESVREVRESVQASLDSAAAARAEAEAAGDAAPAEAPSEDPAAPPAPPTPPTPVTSSTGEILRFGSDIHVPAGQLVEGDVVSMGGDIEVEGHVTGNVTSMGGDVTLRSGSRVDGSIATLGGELREEPGSSVGGERVTTPRAPGAKLLLPALAVVGTGFQIMLHLVWLAFLLGLTWLVVKLGAGRTQRAVDTIRGEPGTSFLLGLLVLGLLIPSVIVLALVIALLCITIIGIPLAAAVAVAYAGLLTVLIFWGSIVGATVLGSRIRERLRPGNPSLMMDALWGVAILQGLRIVSDLLHVLPLFGFVGGLVHVIGIVLSAVLGVFGAGALIRQEYVRRTVQDWWQRARPTPVGRAVDDFGKRGRPNGAAAPAPPPPPAPASASETVTEIRTTSTPAPPWPPAPPTPPPPAPPAVPPVPPDPPAPIG